MPAHTFNSAGLHRSLLVKRDGNPAYGNEAIIRYNTGRDIDAYYLEFDILNFIQDHIAPRISWINHLNLVPPAIGTRHRMNGPFKTQLVRYADDFARDMSVEIAVPGSSIYVWITNKVPFFEDSNTKKAWLEIALTMFNHHKTAYYQFGMLTERHRIDQLQNNDWNAYGPRP